MKKAIVLLVILGIAGTAGWQVWVRVNAARQEVRRPSPPVAVEVAPVARTTIRDIGVFTGSLQPKSQFIVAPKIGGRVEKLFVNFGDPVKRDQMIAQLDDEELKQEVEQARAEVDVAKANVENFASDQEVARREFERIQTLREKKIASDSELDAAEGRLKTCQARSKVADAQVNQKEATLKAAEVRLDYTRVAAHWEDGDGDGPRIVGERFVDEGALLKANEPIVSVLQDRVLVGAIHVIERDYPKVRLGQEAAIAADAWPGEQFPGRIVRIAPFLKESSRQASVEIDVPNDDRRLAAGMFIHAYIELAAHQDATVVPVAALVKRDGRQGVFVADAQAGKARFVPVKVGIETGEQAEVLEPPLEGLVVTLGHHLLEDGAPILLPQESKPAADPKPVAPPPAPLDRQQSKEMDVNPKPVAPPPAPFGPVPTARQVQWHEMEQYAFVHFSVNTFTDREWGLGDEQAAVFNPTAFDAGQIVRGAKAAGMKGLILTAKHHDGFCLWPTKSTPHNITASPYKNGKGDIVREMADACKQEGLKFGVYVSPWDRNHADYGGPGYVQAYHTQIRELATGYGPIFEMWFDGANGGKGYYGGKGGSRQVDYNTYYGWKEIRAMIRELQPDCAIWCGQYAEEGRLHWADCRWGGSEGGEVGEPCWNAVDSKVMNAGVEMCSHGRREGDLWCPAEGDVSIRPGWFWHESQNGQVKSPEKLMEIYLSCVGRGANLILNMPPDRRGRLHENDVASLKGYGDHLRRTFAVNLAAAAKTQASNTRSHDGAADPFYGPQRLVDADPWSAWVTDDAAPMPEVVLELAGEKTFNLIRLREDIRLGQRVEGVAVDAWDTQAGGGAWKEIAKAQSVGANRLWRIAKTTADKLRLRVTQAPVAPALSDFGLFLEPELEARN